MAVVVTGGAGFVGSHLVDRFVRAGAHVVILDNLISGNLANVAHAISSGRATFVYADAAAGAAQLGSLLGDAARGRISAIYHLASPASPEAYGAHPWETLAVNAVGTMSMIEIALEHQATFVFASTSEIYGDPLVHPQPESYFGNVNPIGPRACYDEGKRFGEAAVSVAAARRGLDARIVRIFNCYGPRMELGDGRLIPALAAAAFRRAPMPILGSGTQTRSLTYVDDLIDGMLLVAGWRPLSLTPVNLGSTDERSVLEIARVVATVAGVPYCVEHHPARPEDPRRRCPDIALARSLGWEPTTPLAVGLGTTYEWFARDALAHA